MRILARGLALLVVILPCASWPLGLGEIAVDTSLNQPLHAEIQMFSIHPEEVEDVSVTLATQEAFDRVGINRPYVLTQLEFKPTIKGDGQPIILVTTKQPVREPFLNFLMKVEWPRGRLLREYTVLLDPPVLMDKQSSMAMQAPVVESYPGKSVKQLSDNEYKDSTQVETGLMEGVREESQAKRLAATSQTQEKAVESAASAHTKPSTYRTQRGDTLGEVAQKLRPDDSINLSQMMIAMLRANPDAFIRGNINNLMAGVIVRIPERSEIESIDLQQAYAEVATQNSLWRQYRAKLATQTPPQPLEQTVPGAPSGGDKSLVGSAEVSVAEAGQDVSPLNANLEILASKQVETSDTKTVVAQGVDVAALQKEMALAQELAESRLRENEELLDKINELEAIVTQQERLINLQSEELAGVQQQLAGEDQSSADQEQAEPVESTAPEIEMDGSGSESMEEAPAIKLGETDEQSVSFPTPEEAEERFPASAVPEVPVESETVSAESLADLEESEAAPVESGAVEVEPSVAVQPEPQVEEQGGETVLKTGENAESELASKATAPTITSVFDRMMANPIILLALAGTGFTVLAVVWLLVGRAKRRLPKSASESSEDEKTQDEVVATAVEDAEPEVEVPEVLAESRVSEDEEVQGDELQPVEPVEPKDESPAVENQKQESRGDDTLAEADVYIAYGLYDQADELLKDALATDSSRNDYRVKLLEAYFGAQNKDAFNALAQELHENVNGSGELWERAQVMGHEINPENPLFQGGSSGQLDASDLAPKKLDTADIDLGIEEFDADPEQAPSEVALAELGTDLSDDTLVAVGSEVDAITDLDTDSEPAFDFDAKGPVEDEAEPIIEFKLDDGEIGDLSAGADDTYVDLTTLSEAEPGRDEDNETQDTVGIAAPSSDGEEDVLEFDVNDLDLGTDDQGSEAESDLPVQSLSDEELLEFEISDLDFNDTAEETSSVDGADIDASELDVSLNQPDPEEPELAATEIAMEHVDDALSDTLSTEVEYSPDEIELGEDTADIETILQGIAHDKPTEIQETTEHVEATEEFDISVLDPSLPEEQTEIEDPTAQYDASDDEDIDSGDDVGTKLDLARAYLEMGDSSGARSTLEEILQEGDSAQRKEAEDLLQQIA